MPLGLWHFALSVGVCSLVDDDDDNNNNNNDVVLVNVWTFEGHTRQEKREGSAQNLSPI